MSLALYLSRVRSNEVLGGALKERPINAAIAATRSLMKYLETPTPGLWRDTMDERGAFVEQLAPASSFYHIVSAALQLQRTGEK